MMIYVQQTIDNLVIIQFAFDPIYTKNISTEFFCIENRTLGFSLLEKKNEIENLVFFFRKFIYL